MLRERLGEQCAEREIEEHCAVRFCENTVLGERLGEHYAERRLGERFAEREIGGTRC